MEKDLLHQPVDGVEIIELDERLDMALDPLVMGPLANWGCGHTCGTTCTNNLCVGDICGTNCC